MRFGLVNGRAADGMAALHFSVSSGLLKELEPVAPDLRK